MTRFLPSALLVIVAACCFFSGVEGQPASPSLCGLGASGSVPEEINVGVLVWADTAEVLLTQPITSYPPIDPTTAGFQTAGVSVLQPFYLGIDFYQRRLNAVGGKIPVLGGAANVTINIHYVNLGRVNWDHITSGYPDDGYVSAAFLAPAPGGLFDTLAYNSSQLLGANRTFTFFVAHPLLASFVEPLLNRIEDQQTAILMHPFQSTPTAFVCDGLPATVSLTPDCVARNRLLGARRFETLFSAFPDLSHDAAPTLELYHTLGIKRIAVFREAVVTNSYPLDVFVEALAYADDLNLQVVLSGALQVLQAGDCAAVGDVTGTSADSCPPSPLLASQNQVWPNGSSGLTWATKLRDLGVEGVIFIALTGTGGAWSFGQLFRGMQEIDYTPKSLSWVGAFEKGFMAQYLPNGAQDMRYTTGEIVWHKALRGVAYRPVETATNFELIQGNATAAGPAVFADQFNALYGPGCTVDTCVAPAVPGTAHPFWPADAVTVPVITYAAMVQIQKLIESAASANVPHLLRVAPRVNAPSVYERIAFDGYGRLARFDSLTTQYGQSGADNDTDIITPFNIGVPVTFPIPTWSEREYAPKWYATSSERVVLALTSIGIVGVVLVWVAVMLNLERAVIRATTPSMAHFVSAGALLMLMSNFFNTLHTNNVHCGLQSWFLTVGLTLLLSSLFVKTFRIWRIFVTSKLQVVVIRDAHLFRAVIGFVLVDVLLNTIWQASGGMSAHLVIPDPLRPSLSYMECDYTSSVSTGVVYTQIVYKAAIVLCGIPLTWKVRNVPTSFNESMLLSWCIYNVMILACFIVPLVGTGIGGRSTTMLIRGLAVVFLSLTTLLLLYAPKFYWLLTGQGDKVRNETQMNTTTSDHNKNTAGVATNAKQLTPTARQQTTSRGKKIPRVGSTGGSLHVVAPMPASSAIPAASTIYLAPEPQHPHSLV